MKVYDSNIFFIAFKSNNVYKIEFEEIISQVAICFSIQNDTSWLLYERLDHANIKLISKLLKKL